MRALAFDVFGTLLDPAGIEKALRGIVPDPPAFAAAWRAKQLEHSFLLAAMGRYRPFSDVTAGALRYVAAREGIDLGEASVERLTAAWSTLPAFPEAREALAALRPRVALAVLSNGDPEVLEGALRGEGLRDSFREVISAAEAKALKPSPRVYAHGAERLGLPPTEVGLVSSNAFDVIGAKAAGMSAIWVNRSGAPFEDLGFAADAEIRRLRDLVKVLRD